MPRHNPSRHRGTIIVGAGLAGLVAAAELVAAGERVTIIEQEPESNFGGQAWWSYGYRSLEGTFLGGCLFSGRQAGRAIAAAG